MKLVFHFTCILFFILTTATTCLGIATGAHVDESSFNVIYYINQRHPAASDSNNGTTPGTPYKTFGRGFSRALTHLQNGSSVKLVVYPGIYREGGFRLTPSGWSANAKNAVLVIEGTEPRKVIFSGADIWTNGWSAVEGYDNLYMRDWPYTWGFGMQPWDSYNVLIGPRGERRELLIFNNTIMEQILLENYTYYSSQWNYISYTGLDVLSNGQFAVVEAVDPDTNRPAWVAHKIFFKPPEGESIDSACIELSTRDLAFRIGNQTSPEDTKNNTVFRNCVFQNYSDFIYAKEVVRLFGNNSMIEDCEMRDNNIPGFGMGEHFSSQTVRRVHMYHNGYSGGFATRPENFLVEDTYAIRNNWRGDWGDFNGWAVAGIKIMGPGSVYTKEGVHVRRYHALQNLCHGLWFDHSETSPAPVYIEQTLCSDNKKSFELYVEKQPGPITIDSSVLWHNNAYGALQCVARNVTLRDSILRTFDWRAIQFGNRNNSLYNWSYNFTATNSVLFNTDTSGFIFVEYVTDAQWNDFLTTYKGYDNTFYNPYKEDVFNASNGVFVTLDEWKSLVDSDTQSQWENPSMRGDGWCSWQFFTNITDGTVASLTSSPPYITRHPVDERVLAAIDVPPNFCYNYGGRVRAYLYPPSTGMYTFCLAASDEAELWLGTNQYAYSIGTSPIVRVTQPVSYHDYSQNAEQVSTQIFLNGGDPYYIEMLYATHTNYSHATVAWVVPGNSSTQYITAPFISPYTVSPPVDIATQPGVNYTVYTGAWTALPAQSSPAAAVHCGIANDFSDSVVPSGITENVILQYNGYLSVSHDSIYTYSVENAIEVRLTIDSCTVISYGKTTGEIALARGKHSFVLEYIMHTGAYASITQTAPNGIELQLSSPAILRSIEPLFTAQTVPARSLSTWGSFTHDGDSCVSYSHGCASGRYTSEYDAILSVGYYDNANGAAHVSVFTNQTRADEWTITGDSTTNIKERECCYIQTDMDIYMHVTTDGTHPAQIAYIKATVPEPVLFPFLVIGMSTLLRC